MGSGSVTGRDRAGPEASIRQRAIRMASLRRGRFRFLNMPSDLQNQKVVSGNEVEIIAVNGGVGRFGRVAQLAA